MACNSKANTLRWFMKREILSETREILDIDKFNMANTIFTERAINEYGLNTLGNLLFTTSESEAAVGIAKDRAIRKKIRRAEPNSVLFDNLDKLIEAKETREANQRPDAINESPKEVKEGVEDLFESNPELASIGTPEQYSAYLDTIFPDSKVKDIVYHGSNRSNITFDSGRAAYFITDDKSLTGEGEDVYSYKYQIKALINIVKPLYINQSTDKRNYIRGGHNNGLIGSDGFFKKISKSVAKKDIINDPILSSLNDKYKINPTYDLESAFRDRLNEIEYSKKNDISSPFLLKKNDLAKNTDGFLIGDTISSFLYYTPYNNKLQPITNDLFDRVIKDYPSIGKNTDYVVVFEPEQIHILGSKQDIEGFKQFISGAPMFMKTPEVGYSFKVINALSKINRNIFETSKLQGWLNDLAKQGVPAQQLEIFKDIAKPGMTKDEITAAIAANYSYAVEINTAKSDNPEIVGEMYEHNGKYYVIGIDGAVEISKERFLQGNTENSNYYSNLTVPGGTNYTENEIATPDITPSIKGHAQFATDKGIGWFRSDEAIAKADTSKLSFEQLQSAKIPNSPYDIENNKKAGVPIINEKTRRILEVQSDLFQKGRDKELLVESKTQNRSGVGSVPYTNTGKYAGLLDKIRAKANEVLGESRGERPDGQTINLDGNTYYTMNGMWYLKEKEFNKENQFLQLLNKDNNWVTFFVKSIIQDSAKKGYEKVLFPTGNTASKVEGHTTLEEFKKEKEDRIKELEKELEKIEEVENSDNWFALQYKIEDGVIKKINSDSPAFTDTNVKTEEEAKEIVLRKLKGRPSATFTKEKKNNEIVQLKQELERVEKEGFGALKPIYNFYENTVTNILKKQGYNPTLITDEYGNTWNEITVKEQRDLAPIAFLRASEYATLSVEDAIAKLKQNQSMQIAQAMAERLRLGLGVSYQIIDRDTAVKILENAPIKYNGEPAFYYNNTAYFLQDNFNLNSVLHEFAHPFIAAIRRDNPDLFDNLYDQVRFTAEGEQIIEKVKSLYPELKEGTNLFKEEVIVYALQQSAYNQVNNEVQSKGFESFIENLLYAIKKILRKLFGQSIRVSDIKANTTLEQLADKMINSELFDISSVPTEKDYVAFLKSEKTRIDKLDNTAKEIAKNISADAMIKTINLTYSNIVASLQTKRKLKKSSPEYRMLENAILKQGTNELLDSIKNSLAGYQTVTKGAKKTREQVIDEALVSEIERIEDLTRKSTNLVHSFNTINNIIENINKDLVDLKQNKNLGSRSVMTLVGIYKNLLAGWEDLAYNTDQIMTQDFALSVNDPFSQLIGAINTNISRGKTILKDIYKESSVRFYKEYTGYMHDFVQNQLKSNLLRSLKKIKNPLTDEEIEDFYNKIIDDSLTNEDMTALVGRGANKQFVQDFINEYNTYKIDETKIRDLLEGKLEDVNWFNRFLEAYTSSTDPIVGGLAVYLQDVRTDAVNQALQESERFRSKLEDVLQKVGFNKLSTRQLLKLTTFEDTVGIFNDKGELVDRMVYTFQQEFKNYRFDIKKLDNEYQKAKESGDSVKIAKAAKQIRKFNMDYMWDKYLPEVYEADELFESEIGKLAWLDRQTVLDKFRTESFKYQDELERFDKYSSAQMLWNEYKRLFELTYIDGSPKVDDPANGIYDLSKAMILREHREKSRQYRTFIPREGSLQTAYNEFVNLLVSQNIKRGSDEFNEKLAQWEKQNLRIAYSEEYYTSKRNDLARLRELQAKENAVVASDFDRAAAYEEIFNLINGFRDEQNQPVPSELGPERLKRIKELQEQIIDFNYEYNSNINLTDAQRLEFDTYEAKIAAGQELSKLEKTRYISLLDKQGEGLSLAERKEMTAIFKRLSELSSKVPTDYYIDTLNYYLNKLEQPEVTAENVDEFINSPEFSDIVYSDDKFANWFINNHVEVEKFIGDKPTIVRERLMAYSVTVPSNPDHILKTSVIDNTTGKEVTFNGIPNARHSKYVVKNEYRTIPLGEEWEDYIGIFKDPAGNWLPRKYEPGKKNSAVDAKYINEEYASLKNTPQFELIELLKNFSIDVQKNLPLSSRLGYDMPRFFIDNNLEILQGQDMTQKLSQIKGSYKAWIDDNFRSSSEAEFERSHNFNPTQIFVNTDLLGEEISYVPIRGTYNMEPEKVSPDVIRSLFRYQMSAILQTKLIESASLVEGILETLDDPSNAPKDPTKLSRQKFKVEGVLGAVSKGRGNTYNRREQVRSLLMRELYGRNVVGIEESNPWLFKMTNFMQKTAGKATLAVNIPSDLKNRYGQVIQNLIEASGGQFINLKSFALGKVWSTKAMVEWSAKGIYTTGQQSLTVQLIQQFDPAFKTEADYGKSPGRSMIKDLIDGSWMYDFRKFGELEAALQLFGGFMHHKYIDQKLSDGTVIPIRYIDAWELDEDGVMTLKNGIDPEWGTKQVFHTYIEGETLQQIADKYFITVDDLKSKNEIKDVKDLETGTELVIAKGVKFKRFKNQFQAVSRQLYGNYDQFGQPEGNMYLAYRMFFFMRKWATTGFLKRFGMSTKKGNWGGKRYDWALGQPTRGYYITSFLAGYKLLKSWGNYYNYMDEQDKADVKRFISEGFTTLFLAMAALLIFGYDDDDEDRFDKIAGKSGPMFTPDFKLRGYLTNHMLFLTMGVFQETSTFAPIPGLGLDEYSKFMSVTSTSFNSTIKIYMKIFEDIVNMMMMNDSAYYKRDVGPYSWQKEGSAKIITHVLSAFGFSGRTGDPETLIQNMEKYGKL